MRQSFLFLCLLFSIFTTQAQQSFSVSGTVKDTFNFSSTIYSSVSLIRVSDSILQSFTRTDENGKFSLKVSQAGAYILLGAHPNFAEYTDVVQVEKDMDLGQIPLLSKRHVLEEVIIKDRQKIVIKGDTVEFNADSFQTRQYDNVDELLKKLPGIEISKDGSIKAYGEKVQKMLVDGEEFFSDDPAVVSKTLRASTVDKVQVFDKKSDQAEFTGIDDGEKIKTINLKLKDEAKQGYFGKVGLGGGLPEYWENQAMINSFTKKRKISAYGTMSNTNTTGLDWSDQSKYGSGEGMFVSGGRMSQGGNSFNGQGIPKSWSAGTQYNNKWFDNKLKFNSGYRYSDNISEAISNNRTQFILPDTQYVNQQNNTQSSGTQAHNINTSTEYEIDSSSSIRLTLNGSYTTGFRNTFSKSESAALNGSLINNIENNQEQKNDNQSLNGTLFYWKRFSKKGRSFSARLNGDWGEGNGSGFQKSNYNLFAIDSAYVIDQRKENENKNLNFNSKFTYTEPLSEKIFLELNYGLSSNSNQSLNNSYDRGNGSQMDVLNELYSSNYEYNSFENQGGANIRINWEKISLNFGGNVSNTQYKQIDKMLDSTISYANFNFFPSVGFTFKRSRQSNFRLYYNGSTKQPDINQLQPLRQNENPLDIAIGNPNLKQEFNHNFNLNFYNYKMLSGQYTMVGMNFSFVQDAISQRQFIDISGRRTYQYVNVNGNFNANAYANYSLKKIGNLHPSFGLNGNYSRINDFINGDANINSNTSIAPNLYLRYNQDTTFNVSYSLSPQYTDSRSSIRPDIKTNYWAFNQNFDGSVMLPFRFQLGTGIEWNIRQKLDPQEKNNNVFFWTAYASKSFLKDRSLVARLYVNDILNQNLGYNRYNTPNQISETSYNTIKRYFLLSLTWNFTKTGTKAPSSSIFISE